MEIDEISLVDQGANPSAYVKFFKNKGDNMDIEDLTKRLEEVENENKDLLVKAGMSDAEKAYMDGLNDEAKKKFMGMGADERKKMMGAGKMDKSFDKEAVEKQLADIEKRLAEKDDVIKSFKEEIAKMADENEMLKLEKRAEAELAGIAGTAEQKAKLLKALDGIEDEDVKKMALENIKKSAETNINVTKEYGASGQGQDDANGKLEALAKAKAKETGVSFAKAYKDVLDTDEGRELLKKSRTQA